MTARLKRVTALHATALAAIHADAFRPTESWSSEIMALHLNVPGAFGLMDTRGGMILARVAADEAEVVTLAVRPAVRRKGIGESLLRGAMQQARQNGASAMFLEVDVENDAAQRLYTRLGFAEVGRRPHYYASGADALILRCDL